MKHFLVCLLVIVFSVGAFAQQQHYSRAKIYFDKTGHNMRSLAALGVAADHGEYKKNTFFISDFSENELKLAKDAGFRVEILIADVVKHYQEKDKKKVEKTTSITCDPASLTDPTHFHLGSYGGFFTYDEMLAILDSMQLLYPGLISVKQPIGTFTTIQGQPIYWIRVSNNPSVDQPAKPQVLYTAVHHAREPGSMAATLYYLWYLLEHYATDAHVKALVDNEELYFVPCLNPDGYQYNISMSSTGGGMWRKNLRDNGDGTTGVDLNRNYGYFWGYDDVGSSPTTSSETYRGTAGFSEPETQAIKWFADNHHFAIGLNYHTFGNDMIFPWGYIGSYQTVDSDRFFAFGDYMTAENRYRFGTSDQTVGYITNGDSDDWLYGDTASKPKVFGMTPELGLSDNGFYPPATQIVPDCQNALYLNLKAASLLLPCADITNTDGRIWTNTSGYVHYNLKKIGLSIQDTFTVRVIPLDSWLTLPTTTHQYPGLAQLQFVTDSFSYTINPATPNNQPVSFVLQLFNGLYYVSDTVRFYYGKYNTITTPATSGMSDWSAVYWSVCTGTYHTPPASIKSSLSCTENYPDGIDNSLQLNSPVNLTHSINASLEFWAKWGIEANYDYLAVFASSDGGFSWNPLCGDHTKNGSSYQLPGSPVYDGQRPDWILEHMDLSDYLGTNLLLKFDLVSDGAVDYEGFYIDDISVTTVEAPPAEIAATKGLRQNVHIYPDPASDLLTISGLPTQDSKTREAVLYDCVGRAIKTFEVSGTLKEIHVVQIPEGLYYLRIQGVEERFPVVIWR